MILDLASKRQAINLEKGKSDFISKLKTFVLQKPPSESEKTPPKRENIFKLRSMRNLTTQRYKDKQPS